MLSQSLPLVKLPLPHCLTSQARSTSFILFYQSRSITFICYFYIFQSIGFVERITVNEFKERMTDALTEAKAALSKSKDDMAKYYDRRRTPAPDYHPGNRVYLDASDIHMTRPSQKLSHKRLGPFTIVRKVGNGAYRLCLPPSMSRLHPVFNVVKLIPAPEDPIQGRRPRPPPLPEVVNGEEEWIVEEILDSRMVNQKLRYLVKWEGFGIEHNSWEAWDNIHAPDLVADFHRKHSGAP